MRVGGIWFSNIGKIKLGKKESVSEFSASTETLETSAKPSEGTIRKSALSSLLLVEDTSERRDKKQRAIQNGKEILSLLEELHNAMLKSSDDNAISESLLLLVRNNQLDDDLDLNDILKQIEVRAKVELAKRGIYQ